MRGSLGIQRPIQSCSNVNTIPLEGWKQSMGHQNRHQFQMGTYQRYIPNTDKIKSIKCGVEWCIVV